MSTKATKPIRQKKGNVSSVKNIKFNKKQMVSNQFKPKKTRIVDDFKINNDDENAAEFRFLYKLYVPNYLIKNNKVSITDLMPYLPILVGDGGENEYGNINLELHLFLSSIMVNYINSWYLTKLNTDNYDFVIEVYDLLTKFTKDICKRILGLVFEYDDMFDLLDKLSSVVNDHIASLVKDKDDKYDLKIINDYYLHGNQQNLPNQPDYDIVASYLSSQHVIFQTNHLIYFRLLVKELLQSTFQQDSPMNSAIGSSLVISLLSDLVLDKIYQKLSSPQFIVENINKIVLIMNDKLKQGSNKPKPSIWKKIDGFYKNMKCLVNFTWPTYKLRRDILNNSVFRLLNTLTGFTDRVPYFSSAILLINNTIHQNSFLNSKLNSLAVQSLKSSYKVPIFSQKQICHQISTLRHDIFYRKENEEETAKPEITIPVLIENIQSLKRLFSDMSPLPQNFLNYQYESEQEFKTCLNNVLLIFNYQPHSNGDNISQTCQLNQLLIINLLDVIIHQLYPQI